MEASTVVKAKIIYDVGSSSYEALCIITYGVFLQFADALTDVSSEWISLKGRLNDADNNAVDYLFKRETIKSIDCIKVNGLE